MSAFLERFRADLPVPFDAAAAEVVAPARPPIVSFHFGLPSPDLLERVAGGHRGLSLSEDLQDQIGTLALVAEHNGLLQDSSGGHLTRALASTVRP